MEKLNFKLTILITMSLAAQLLMENLDQEIKYMIEDYEWRRETRFGLGAINKNLNKASEYFNKARTAYERFLEPSRTRCLKDKKTGKFSVQFHDDNMRDANEMLRLEMLYYDKCFQNLDNVNAVFKFLRSLEGQGIFTDEDIEQFRM